MEAWRVIGLILTLTIGLAVSYLLARAGEPQSAWLWCDVAGLCDSPSEG